MVGRVTTNELKELRKNPFVKKTKLMHYLYSAHFVNQPLHVSGIFVAHHQELYCIYIQQLVGIVLHSSQLSSSDSLVPHSTEHSLYNKTWLMLELVRL